MTFPTFDPSTLPVPAGAWAVALALLKSTSILLAALAVTLGMRRAAAGSRHLVWFVALASLLALPAVALWAPLRIHVLPELEAKPVVTAAALVSEATTAPAPAAQSAVQPTPSAAPGVRTTTTEAASSRLRSIDLGTLVVAAWLLVAALLLVQLAVGTWAVRRIVRGARVLDGEDWTHSLYEIADRLGLPEAPQLLQSDRVSIPFATGFLRTRIVLPAESEQWSLERRNAVLIHELGHVRRRDLVAHTTSRIVCALYWFHPLVWTAARRLRAESERACDDLALVLGARPSEYAEHLLDIVTQIRHQRTPAVALAMANPNEFEGRMLAILDPRLRRRGLGRLQASGLVSGLAAMALLVAALSPAPRAATRSAETGEDATAAQVRQDAAADQPADGAPVARAERAASDDAEPAQASALDEQTAGASDDDEDVANERDSEEASSDEAGDQRVEVLARTLARDSNADVRRVAAWGLGQYASHEVAAQELATAMVEDEEESVREMAAWALGGSRGRPATVSALHTVFRREKHVGVRRTAAWAAGSIGDPSLVPPLVDLLDDPDPSMREVAAWSIGNCSPERAPAALVRLLSDPNAQVRLSTAWALREIADPNSADALEAAFRREKDPDVQHGLIRALGSMGDRAVDTLTRLLGSSDPEIRAVAVTALAGGNATGPWPWPRPEPRPFP